MWRKRIDNANRLFTAWENKFRCKQLYKYYEGFQWSGRPQAIKISSDRRYVLNLVASTIDIKLAGFLFQKPEFTVDPAPGECMEYDIDSAAQSAQLKEDLVNTITKNPNINFVDHIRLCALDSFFYFGIMEIGLAKDFRNPQFEMPEMTSDSMDESGEPLTSPGEADDKIEKVHEVDSTEQFYVKRIIPEHFRVSAGKKSFLNDHSWVGYYEFYPTNVLKEMPGIKWPEGLSAQDASLSTDSQSDIIDEDRIDETGQSKVWQIWDLVSKKWLFLLDSHMDVPLAEHSFDTLPLVDVRWKIRRKGWYPKPPVFDWLSPQDEINEARVQEQNARRKFVSKYQFKDGMVDEEEVDKFTSGGDGTVVKVKEINAIQPIQNVDISPSSQNALRIAENDFNIISGTSAEARGAADRETATQSKLINDRAQIRESFDQMQFEIFVSRVASALIRVAENELDGEAWAKVAIPQSNDFFAEYQQFKPLYQKVEGYKFKDGYDFTIQCSTQNDTPQAMAAKKQSFLSFITIVSQYPVLASNPVLIREAAISVGYRNEKVIAKMQQAAVLAVQTQMGQQSQAQPGQPPLGQGGNANNTQMQQMGIPDSHAIQHQLQHQIKQ